jgi:hypothetical protein
MPQFRLPEPGYLFPSAIATIREGGERGLEAVLVTADNEQPGSCISWPLWPGRSSKCLRVSPSPRLRVCPLTIAVGSS